jgi:hypothetical protein
LAALDAAHRNGQDAIPLPNPRIMHSRTIFIEQSQVTSSLVRKFDAYWKSKQGGARVAPLRNAIDPIEIPQLLPFMVIAQLEREPFRVRYRLVGTRVVDAHGADFTNRYLDECGFLIEKELTESYRRIMLGAPVYLYFEWIREDWPHDRGRTGASESAFFPLSSDGGTIDMAINIADPSITPRPLIAPI